MTELLAIAIGALCGVAAGIPVCWLIISFAARKEGPAIIHTEGREFYEIGGYLLPGVDQEESCTS